MVLHWLVLENLLCAYMVFIESGYTWDGIVVPGYQLIRIDTIGHGDSDIPEDENAFFYPYHAP